MRRIAAGSVAALAWSAAGWAQNTAAVPVEAVKERVETQRGLAEAVGAVSPKQIVFGDTHVHTMFSVDAYLSALPIFRARKEGGYPVEDACDFARYCSALDFYFLTDHAEGYTHENWQHAKESIRKCNALADPETPDLIAYMGYEWTQAGTTPEEHYGHKNVLFMGDQDDELPARPIAAGGRALDAIRGSATANIVMLGAVDTENRAFYQEFGLFAAAMRTTPPCPEGVDSKALPENCLEVAETPAQLYEKLDQWELDTIVIPHGTTWGFYTPPTTNFDKHLENGAFDADKQRLIEIFSGHGNSEQFRTFKEIGYDAEGAPFCPEPSKDYLPSCWRAGEIIRERCLKSGFDAAECEARAVSTRAEFVRQPSVAAFRIVPDAQPKDWLDAGQARNMFKPAFNYRPGESVQYSMAIANFEDPENPLTHRWGFIGSSDNHRSRPGTGFKQYGRYGSTEATGAVSEHWSGIANRNLPDFPAPNSLTLEDATRGMTGFALMEMERQASYFVTGGLAAVHTEGRSREQIWDAMKRKEVYATSGERILLWFDLVNGPGGRVPMGGEAALNEAPQFEVRAVGAFKQLPGCPERTETALGAAEIDRLCGGECDNPSDERKAITRIEVVRIRPQIERGEEVAQLIEDPWKVIECEPNAEGCVATFDDPDFAASGRSALYYVRAIEEPSLAVNGQNLRAQYDANGNPISVNPCYGDYRTDPSDDCLGEVEERAWSSPIFIDPK